jgi:GWxTD domain-containing protein
MLSILLESAVRTLGLAVAVWLVLRLFRVRSVQVQSLVWTAVLLSALSMPFLMFVAKSLLKSAAVQWLPATLPSLWLRPIYPEANPVVVASIDWLRVLSVAYLAISGVLLLRMFSGIWRGYRLRRTSIRLNQPWAHDVRVNHAITVPATVGRTILLPADWVEWNAFECTAVLRHEEAHVRRGDFYIYLMARLNRTVFWFNPVAWWLERKIIQLAEAICDDAAIQLVEDRISYAEILVRLTGKISRQDGFEVAMARGRTVADRVERVLRETTISPEVSFARRIVSVAVLVPLVALMAGTWVVEAKTATVLRFAQEPQTPQFLVKWAEQEVPDLISDAERSAFEMLRTDEEREKFIEQFWLRRDPDPATADNEFRNEYYRRITLANERYTSGIPGWKTDRGRIFTKFGPPDEIETHAQAQPPSEKWLYRFIDGIGSNVILEFSDAAGDGTYRLVVPGTTRDKILR